MTARNTSRIRPGRCCRGNAPCLQGDTQAIPQSKSTPFDEQGASFIQHVQSRCRTIEPMCVITPHPSFKPTTHTCALLSCHYTHQRTAGNTLHASKGRVGRRKIHGGELCRLVCSDHTSRSIVGENCRSRQPVPIINASRTNPIRIGVHYMRFLNPMSRLGRRL